MPNKYCDWVVDSAPEAVPCLGFFYKVTTGKRVPRSALARKGAETRYLPQKWVVAPNWLSRIGYGLTVFDSFCHAKVFACTISQEYEIRHVQIWLAECRGEIYPLPPALDLGHLERGVAVRGSYPDWIAHTRMFRQVRLVKCLGYIPRPRGAILLEPL